MRRKFSSCRFPTPTFPGLIRYFERLGIIRILSQQDAPLRVADDGNGSTPSARNRLTISGTAAAASWVLTVTRTNSDPASQRSHLLHCGGESAVSVFVMDWTTMG
jgi:hypothetical protein